MVVLIVGVVVGVVLIVALMRLFARRLLARRLAVEEELVRTGVETTATVTRVPPPQRGWNRNGGVWGQVTFTFSDASAVEHSVKRRILIRTPGAVMLGQTSRLWYDASAPEDAWRIVVDMERSSRPTHQAS